MNPRLAAVCDASVANMRESAGMHERFDGVVQDLSPEGVSAALARLGDGPPEPDAHDEAHLLAAEAELVTAYGVVEEHRRNPLPHLGNLDLSGYDRQYGPASERDEARRRHLAAWPDAVDAAVDSLDRVPAAVARALLPAARGLDAGLPTDDEDGEGAVQSARAALRRLVAHLEHAGEQGDPDASVGAAHLASLMGDGEAMPVELARVAERADAERNRLVALMHESCQRYRPGSVPSELVPELLADHPSEAAHIYSEAADQIVEATAFTLERALLPDVGGECMVGPAPPSRRWAMAMMSWAAPLEPDAPSWYYVTPPDPSWPEHEQAQWLEVFSRTTLPAITVHEVMPGHYAHGRMLRRATGDVRRALFSSAFVEGWAHYGEELLVEEGFRDRDPRYAIGVCIEALVRVTRLAVAIGLHTGAMSMDDAVHRFRAEAFLGGPAARAEAHRAGYDPTYGRYTWGKLQILALRDEAVARWGRRYSHLRFHEALLGLGAPPLGLMGDAVGE
ncbi:MAG: DUF885 domain-containing protein [Actinomycetota bacterium]|nr:DUF885 domain-containing protein [Actinomycetota bacterium]